jgi:hypothetical protein
MTRLGPLLSGANAVVAVAVALVLFCAAQTARAATCGETPSGEDKPVKATLTLDPGQSSLSKDFKRSLKTKELSMYFKAAGCDLPDDPADPSLAPIALKGQDNIPHDTLRVLDTTTFNDQLIISFSADPNTFDPGSYSSAVLVKADYLKTASATVSVSRSMNEAWQILVIAIVLGFGLFFFITLGAYAGGKLGLSRWRLVAAGVLVIITTVVAAASNYWPQTVWTYGDNLYGLLAAAVGAALASSFAGLITGGGSSGGGAGAGAAARADAPAGAAAPGAAAPGGGAAGVGAGGDDAGGAGARESGSHVSTSAQTPAPTQPSPPAPGSTSLG